MISSLQEYLTQSVELPLLTAFVLGLLVSLNPCQLAISLSALSFLFKRNPNDMKWMGLRYASGRALTYFAGGMLLRFTLGRGLHIEAVGAFLSKGESALPYLLLLLGLFFAWRAFHHHHHTESCHHSGYVIHKNGKLGAFVLGLLLAFLFCPESAVLYFGVLLPLSVSTSSLLTGILSLFLFALAAAVPPLLLAWMLRSAANNLSRMERGMEYFQQWANAGCAVLFIALAVLLWLFD